MGPNSTANGRLDSAQVAPVHNFSNNSHAQASRALDIEQGFGPSDHDIRLPPPPQTTQIAAPPGISLAGHSRSYSSSTQKQDQHVLAAAQREVSANSSRRHTNSGPSFHCANCSCLHSSPTLEPESPAKDIFRRPRTLSPDNYRRSILNKVPEEMESNGVSSAQYPAYQVISNNQRYYGSMGNGNPSIRVGSTERPNLIDLTYDEESDLSEEEEDWLLDEELAKQGLYRGNYTTILALYSLVPISSLIAFVSLALIPIFAFPSRVDSPFPYAPYLPYPLPEVLTAGSLWSVAYLLREPLYAISLAVTSLIPFPRYRFPEAIPFLTSALSAILQSGSALSLRQLAVPILLVPYYSTERHGLLPSAHSDSIWNTHKHHFPTWQDSAFHRVWWIALGWAIAEAVVGIKQGYENIGLYKDVLVGVEKKVTRSGFMTETRSPALEQRERTPSNAKATTDVITTPTQRDWNTQPGESSANAAGGMTTPSTVRPQNIRQHSSSLSSSDSSYTPYPAEDTRNLGSNGEARPLLVGNYSSNYLSRQMTRESDRLMVENEVERDLEELIMLKNREELEEIYGIPVIRIPVFLSCLHHINSILSSLAATLLLTAAYMRSTFAYGPPVTVPATSMHSGTSHPSNKMLFITFPCLLAVQALLTLMHTPWVLPRLGVHTFVYIELLISLGLFFGGLGVWEALT